MPRDPRGPSPLARTERAVSTANTIATATLFGLIAVVVLWGVFTRFVLGEQAVWTDECARLLLVWVTMLGGAMAYSAGAHLGLDAVVNWMDPRSRHVCQRFGAAIIFLFAVSILIIGGATLLAERLHYGQTLPALRISRAWQYAPLPIAGVLIAITATKQLLEPDPDPTPTPRPTPDPVPDQHAEASP